MSLEQSQREEKMQNLSNLAAVYEFKGLSPFIEINLKNCSIVSGREQKPDHFQDRSQRKLNSNSQEQDVTSARNIK